MLLRGDAPELSITTFESVSTTRFVTPSSFASLIPSKTAADSAIKADALVVGQADPPNKELEQSRMIDPNPAWPVLMFQAASQLTLMYPVGGGTQRLSPAGEASILVRITILVERNSLIRAKAVEMVLMGETSTP